REKLASRDPGMSEQDFLRVAEDWCKTLIPTDFKSVGSQSKHYRMRRNNFFKLWELAEDAKKALTERGTDTAPGGRVSPLDAYTIGDEQPGGTRPTLKGQTDFATVSMTRAELDALLREDVERAWAVARDLTEDIYRKGEKVHQIVLAGNGSRYPLVGKVMRE